MYVCSFQDGSRDLSLEVDSQSCPVEPAFQNQSLGESSENFLIRLLQLIKAQSRNPHTVSVSASLGGLVKIDCGVPSPEAGVGDRSLFCKVSS